MFFFLMEKPGRKMAMEQSYKLWRSQDCRKSNTASQDSIRLLAQNKDSLGSARFRKESAALALACGCKFLPCPCPRVCVLKASLSPGLSSQLASYELPIMGASDERVSRSEEKRDGFFPPSPASVASLSGANSLLWFQLPTQLWQHRLAP